MDAVAPLSVLLPGLLGMLIALAAVARIVVTERRLLRVAVPALPVAPPAAAADPSLAA